MSDDTAKWEELTTIAKAFLSELKSDSADAAAARFDEAMTQAMPPAKLIETWATVQQQAGAFEADGPEAEIRTAVEAQYDAVYLPVKFEKAPLFVKVVFENARIAGLQFVPTAPPKQ